MKTFKKAIIFLLIAYALPTFSKDTTINDKQIVQISVRKSGTHLLARCINLLTGKNHITWHDKKGFKNIMYYQLSLPMFEEFIKVPHNSFWATHLFYAKQYAEILHDNKIKTLFIYRDPRDQAISSAFYMKNKPATWPKAALLSFDELLLDIIIKGSTFNNHPPAKGINEYHAAYLPWMQEPDVLCIRFEDLVGKQGGASQESQLYTIANIAQHLELKLSQQELRYISDNLFGEGYTFREGKIGSWKRYFKKEHIKAFKQTAGQLLIDLGYEKDMNW